MEKNFRLSNREESIRGYSNFIGECIDGFALLSLSTAITGYIATVERNKYTLQNALDFVLKLGSASGEPVESNIYSKVATLGVAFLFVARTLIYFIKRYIEWKAVINNATEEDN